jgi:hypothetical protein
VSGSISREIDKIVGEPGEFILSTSSRAQRNLVAIR